MNRQEIRPLHFLFLALVAAGCGSDRVSGNTTETENILTAAEFHVDSLLPLWNHPSAVPTVATLRLDSTRVNFLRTDSLGRDLSIERLDGSPLPFRVVYWDKKGGVGRLLVRLDTASLHQGTRIRLRWGLPIRYWDDSAVVWKALPDSQVLALTSVLVDDFRHASTRTYLPDSSSWYSGVSDSATVSKPTIVAAGKGRTDSALHISYVAPAATFRYSLVGVALAKTPCNLRSLDSIVLWARGSGKLGIAFDRLINNTSGKAWTHRTLDSNWTRIALRPGDLDTASKVGGNIGWSAVRDSVTNLTFLVSGGSDLWLDDIRLYGIDREDLR